ncbi:phage/plasmid primase, P4 family [Desulfoferula mesophila]|uniref:SF3 helicase domain-containing protein n=1 Tax=Desulfoferula mesophila TaxID=3058419 RepID=A0AAU9EF59_9BACT|nr:hypothetical protein FAK_09400 [Desulfoferula mesophilus]
MSIKNTEKNLEAALAYASRSWKVLPLHSVINGECSCGDPNCNKPGKHPRVKNWPKVATDDPRQIEEWWGQWPDANVGILTGRASGIFVLDVDPKNGGDESLDQLLQQYGPLPSTVISNTGGGGKHIVFAYPPNSDIGNSAGRIGPGLDIRGDRGQIVAPPSIHALGGVYAWDKDHHTDDVAIADAPPWLLKLLQKGTKPKHPRKETLPVQAPRATALPEALKKLRLEAQIIASASPGSRNDQLNKGAFLTGQILESGGLDEKMVASSLLQAALAAGLPKAESLDTINSGLTAGKKNPLILLPHPIEHYLAHGQKGDAELFIQVQRGQLCLDKGTSKWFIWTGTRWEEDGLDEHIKRLVSVVGIYEEKLAEKVTEATQLLAEGKKSAANDVDKETSRIRERIAKLGNSPWQKNVVEQAATGEDSLAIKGDEWDANPNLLGVDNGVLEFNWQAATVTLRPMQPDDFIRTTIPTPWPGAPGTYSITDLDALATGPCFQKFLLDICGGDQDKANYLQAILGYALTGKVTEHAIFILHGPEGFNGKTTLTNVLAHVLGDLVGPISVEMLLQQAHTRSAEAASPALVALKSKRMVWCAESDENRKLSSSEIKRLTGGDILVARNIYRPQASFRPTHTIFMLTNPLPDLDTNDAALKERIKVVHFDQRYVVNPKGPNEHQVDTDLPDKLKEDSSQILVWLVQGALIYGKNKKLPECPAVVKATQKYFASKDVIGKFAEECCFDSPGSKLKASDAYNAYQQWCEEEGLQEESSRVFGEKFSKLFKKKRETDGIFYHDIGLK